MSLTEFLLARIAEDEARAPLVDQCPYNLGDITEEEDWAGVHWTSARVLAECEAKRRIVAEHAPFERPYYDRAASEFRTGTAGCGRCISDDRDVVDWPCATMRALAAVYADHPDYREEWRA